MSFSISIPDGPASEFADRAAKAKADASQINANNDYMLTQLASETADIAIKAAGELLSALGAGADGTAYGAVSGHHAVDGVSGSSASASVSFTPAKVEEEPAPAEDVAADPADVAQTEPPSPAGADGVPVLTDPAAGQGVPPVDYAGDAGSAAGDAGAAN